MSRPLHTLRVAGPPGAVFRVTDGASKCVGTGMHQLELALAQGVYTVSALLGRSVESREVLLDEPQSITLQATMPSFGDRAFSLAPAVMAALGAQPFPAGGQLITLRGPWRDAQAAQDRVTLDRDGAAIPALREGCVPDPQGQGVWHWQLFNLAPAKPARSDAPGVLSATRSVCDAAAPTEPSGFGPEEPQAPQPPQRVSHVLPHWGDWVVWAAYPATAGCTPEGAGLPMAYYLRLRLTRPGALPAPDLQSLSDQVFTALAARTGLPLSAPVLDLLLADEADPLLALGAAHLASITLANLGRLRRRLPHDAAQSADPDAIGELQLIDADALQQRFHAWLERAHEAPLATSPDMVAARFLFGIDTRAHLRGPPALLRSLDGLVAAQAPEAQSSGITSDEKMWGMRFQISDSFAFLQWEPDADYQQQIKTSMQRALNSAEAMLSTARRIKEATAQVAREKRDAAQPAKARRKPSAERGAARTMALPSAAELPPAQPSLDLEAFIRSNATSLRMPASTSTLVEFSAVLNNLLSERDIVADLSLEGLQAVVPGSVEAVRQAASAISGINTALDGLSADKASIEATLKGWAARLTKE